VTTLCTITFNIQEFYIFIEHRTKSDYFPHLRHTTLSRTPLHEWSVRRTDLYLTTHNAQRDNIHASAEFESALPASERPTTHAVDRAATGIGLPKYRSIQPLYSNKPTNWTSLWAPLLHSELRMHWNRKRNDCIGSNVKICYLKHWFCTCVAQLALQGKKWNNFPVLFIIKFVFETSKYQTEAKFTQIRKRNSYLKQI
jgi:hypothetical protein